MLKTYCIFISTNIAFVLNNNNNGINIFYIVSAFSNYLQIDSYGTFTCCYSKENSSNCTKLLDLLETVIQHLGVGRADILTVWQLKINPLKLEL